MRRILVLSLIVVPLAAVAAQDRPKPEPPSTSKTSPSSEQNGPIVMQGCVDGRRFVVPMMTPEDLQQKITGSKEYTLEGPSETLALLRSAHDGHFEEITGVLRVHPAPGEEQRLSSAKIGDNTRVTIGRRQTSGLRADGDSAPPVQIGTLTLIESKHLDARCPRW
jgi:hypothetical protein